MQALGVGVLVEHALEGVAFSATVVAVDGEAESKHALPVGVGADLTRCAAHGLRHGDRAVRKNGQVHGFGGAKRVTAASRVITSQRGGADSRVDVGGLAQIQPLGPLLSSMDF